MVVKLFSINKKIYLIYIVTLSLPAGATLHFLLLPGSTSSIPSITTPPQLTPNASHPRLNLKISYPTYLSHQAVYSFIHLPTPGGGVGVESGELDQWVPGVLGGG